MFNLNDILKGFWDFYVKAYGTTTEPLLCGFVRELLIRLTRFCEMCEIGNTGRFLRNMGVCQKRSCFSISRLLLQTSLTMPNLFRCRN